MDIDTTDCFDVFGPPGAGRAAALCGLLELLGTAAILVDRDGAVVGLNDAARDCIGVGIHICNRRLIAADPEAKRALADLIGGIRGACDAEAGAGEQVVVARRNMRPLILRTVPLHGAAAAMCRPASAIIVLLDAGRVSLPTEPQLRRAFGLSDGEARLAIRLAAGETLEVAAGLGGISYETARKRLKMVFEKTDTRRQSELVALMIRVGALAGATRAASGETIPSRPRHPAPGHAPAFRRPRPQPHVTSRSDQWKSTA